MSSTRTKMMFGRAAGASAWASALLATPTRATSAKIISRMSANIFIFFMPPLWLFLSYLSRWLARRGMVSGMLVLGVGWLAVAGSLGQSAVVRYATHSHSAVLRQSHR